jgi:hypothetical protein
VLWNRNYFLRFHKPNPQKILLTIFNFDLNVLKCPILPLFTVPKHNYKLNNNLLTVEPRAVDPHCFDADPDPAQNLDADPDPDPGGGGGVGQPKMCIPPGKILGTPLGGGDGVHPVHPPWVCHWFHDTPLGASAFIFTSNMAVSS